MFGSNLKLVFRILNRSEVVLSSFETDEYAVNIIQVRCCLGESSYTVPTVRRGDYLHIVLLSCLQNHAPIILLYQIVDAVLCFVYEQEALPAVHESQRKTEQTQCTVTQTDAQPENKFQELAFGQPTLAFINAARRELDWRRSRRDHTVAAFLLQHLHDKRGQGLSNQMRYSRALAPRYCIDWWRRHGHDTSPLMDVQAFLHRRTVWRYAKGIPRPVAGRAPSSRSGTRPATCLPPRPRPIWC